MTHFPLHRPAGVKSPAVSANSYDETALTLIVALKAQAHPYVMNISAVLLSAGFALLLDSGLCAAAAPAGSPDLQPQDANVSAARSNESEDVAVTAQIRSALAADEALSADAKRIQIVTNADAVILRGMVRTQEPDRIEAEVRRYAGSRQILNQLTVIDSN